MKLVMHDECYTASAATRSLNVSSLARTAWLQSSFLSSAHWIKVAWIGKVQTWCTWSLILFRKATGFRQRSEHVSHLNTSSVDDPGFLGRGSESVLFGKSTNLQQLWWAYFGYCDCCSLISSSWMSFTCISVLARMIIFKPSLPPTFIWPPSFPHNTQMS